jgi:hypothetical protein
MAPDELTEACWLARQRWNRPASVLHRFWDTRTHLSSPVRAFTYLKYNPLFARENFKKQGMRLGYDPDSIHPSKPGPLAAAGGWRDVVAAGHFTAGQQPELQPGCQSDLRGVT